MQLQISDYSLPQAISFNYEEIKQELTAKVEMYKTLVYTEDQVSSAKKDRANLNAFKKSLNDERIRLEKEYLEPFNDFKNKVNELIKIVDEPVAIIDKQVKGFEEEKKNAKRKDIEELWASKTKPDWLKLEQIWDDKWLNVSVTMKQVDTAIANELSRIDSEIGVIQSLPHADEALILYRESLSISLANAESERIAKIQKAVEESKVSEVIEEHEEISEERMTVSFQCTMTVSQAKALKNFFIQNNIEFKQI